MTLAAPAVNSKTSKDEYRLTEAGVLPNDWSVSSIGEEFTVQLGKMLDAANNSGIAKPYLGNRDVQWGKISLDSLATVPMSPTDLKRFRLSSGDLLVCEGGEVGRAAIWGEPIPECYYQKALHRLRSRDGYDAYLLMCFLRLWTSTRYLDDYVTQTSIAHLPKDKFETVPLPVPPPPEQRAIATALADVDRLIGGVEALIAKKRAVKRAAMQQLLIGRTRLPGFGGEWQLCKMRNCAEVKTGPFGSLLHERDYVEDGTPIITVEHLDDFGIIHSKLPMVSERDRQRLKVYLLKEHDIVFSRVGSINRNALVRTAEEGWLFSGRLLRIRSDRRQVYAPFLSYQFHTEKFKHKVREVAVGRQCLP